MSDFESMGGLKEVDVDRLIPGTKHGDKLLRWIDRLLASDQYGTVVRILGVGVGMAGLYILLRGGEMNDLGPSTVAGLQNRGNNCFLNVILQALASTSCFLPFLNNMLPAGGQSVDANTKPMPLLNALKTLLEELSFVRHERSVLDPEKVMLALGSYVDNFKLTRQQDAAEALLHLLSSLEKELQGSYVSEGSSIAEITESSSRIYKSRVDGKRECERWRTQNLGPFYGTTGSILTCESCSSVISLDIDSFHCLSLSAVLDRNTHIMDGCTLVNCLEKFTAVEHLESYRCARCWHIAALKYLSHMQGENEAMIRRLKHSVNFNSCECEQRFQKKEIPLTVNSHVKKQLIITCCPKILCIQLQRAYMDDHGEFVKLQGHISFPSFLDLSPFVKSVTALVQETLSEDMQHCRKDGHVCTGNITRNELQGSLDEPSSVSKSNNDSPVLENETVSSDFNVSQACSQDEPIFDRKASGAGASCSSMSCRYRLASVVEHYDKSGSGHYAAYRWVAFESDRDSFMGSSGRLTGKWVYASDHAVSDASEDDVFAAEASLLFYERVAHSF